MEYPRGCRAPAARQGETIQRQSAAQPSERAEGHAAPGRHLPPCSDRVDLQLQPYRGQPAHAGADSSYFRDQYAGRYGSGGQR